MSHYIYIVIRMFFCYGKLRGISWVRNDVINVVLLHQVKAKHWIISKRLWNHFPPLVTCTASLLHCLYLQPWSSMSMGVPCVVLPADFWMSIALLFWESLSSCTICLIPVSSLFSLFSSEFTNKSLLTSWT